MTKTHQSSFIQLGNHIETVNERRNECPRIQTLSRAMLITNTRFNLGRASPRLASENELLE